MSCLHAGRNSIVRELIRVELFCTCITKGLWAEAVVGAGRNQQRDRIGLVDFEGSLFSISAHRAAFIQHLDLPLVVTAKHRHRALESEKISRCRDLAIALLQRKIGNLGAHGKGERTLLIGGEPDDHHIVWIGGKILALIAHPALLIGHVGDGFVQVE